MYPVIQEICCFRLVKKLLFVQIVPHIIIGEISCDAQLLNTCNTCTCKYFFDCGPLFRWKYFESLLMWWTRLYFLFLPFSLYVYLSVSVSLSRDCFMSVKSVCTVCSPAGKRKSRHSRKKNWFMILKVWLILTIFNWFYILIDELPHIVYWGILKYTTVHLLWVLLARSFEGFQLLASKRDSTSPWHSVASCFDVWDNTSAPTRQVPVLETGLTRLGNPKTSRH